MREEGRERLGERKGKANGYPQRKSWLQSWFFIENCAFAIWRQTDKQTDRRTDGHWTRPSHEAAVASGGLTRRRRRCLPPTYELATTVLLTARLTRTLPLLLGL